MRTEWKYAAVFAASLAATAVVITAPLAYVLRDTPEADVVWPVQPAVEEAPAAQIKPLGETETPAEPDEPEKETELQNLGTFRLTAYCSCPECCGQWADGITFTGTEATPDRTVAVDPTVIPLGSTVLIDGQEYVAEDIGGAIKGARIDIYFPTHQAALQFGVQYAEVDVVETK